MLIVIDVGIKCRNNNKKRNKEKRTPQLPPLLEFGN
jgi:hypothetical protein